MAFIEFLNTTVLGGVNTVNSVLSNYVLIVVLIGTGLYLSYKTKFVQVRCLGEGFKRLAGSFSLNGKKTEGKMSSFQSLATAVGGQVGTGNIVGVCGALLVGGPGAVFWIWIIAFFGMATNYSEAVLAQKTKVQNANGETLGGPVYYIKYAFKGKFGKFLAGFFAIAITLALGFMGCMVQSNAIAGTLNHAFGFPLWAVGIVLSAICLYVFLGGTKRLASITEKLIPLMAAMYIIGGLAVLIANIPSGNTLQAFVLIFTCAFSPESAVGGGVYGIFAALSQGANRGLFANEAGMGSTPHAHALADVEKPHDQGVVAMMGVFICTYFVVTLTALVVITTMYTDGGAIATSNAASYGDFEKTTLAQMAFATLFTEGPANAFVAIALFFFAFSTIIAWNLFGKINMEYLFGKIGVKIFVFIAVAFIFLGCLVASDLVWALADFFNMIMVIPNVCALIALAGIVAKIATGIDNSHGLPEEAEGKGVVVVVPNESSIAE